VKPAASGGLMKAENGAKPVFSNGKEAMRDSNTVA